ncbi:hypothetical protein [Halobacterium rubrum]|uniref:hypothetical protein n=1 Tax=Halobacterium TaxID=2239 RepID=UPI001F387D2D|nr:MULTISPECIES: hypothetical protein [Halobacterium]MDH5019244.1 hypothetical protein [Halobacterium rubrum]
MNLRLLVSPALYGGVAAAVVAGLGFALADWQSVSIYIPALVYMLGGFSAVGLLAGTASLNEGAESTETHVDQDSVFSAPTESGASRRLLYLCFFLALGVAGVAGGVLLG